jgi:hypothetical protein
MIELLVLHDSSRLYQWLLSVNAGRRFPALLPDFCEVSWQIYSTRCLTMAAVEVSLAIASSRCVPISIRILSQDATETDQLIF